MTASLYQPFPMPGRRRAQAWRHQPAYRRPRHFHAEPEFNLVVRGAATFMIGEQRVLVGPDALLWFPPGLDHYLLEASSDLELFVVGYSPALLEAFNREHGAAPIFSRAPETVSASSALGWAEKLAVAPSSADDAAVESQLLSLLGDVALKAREPRPTLGLRAAMLLLDTPDLGREQLARKLASNRGDVSRRFRREQGLSLAEYRNRLYVLRFMRLLEVGRTNLVRTALEAGFGSYSQCHRVVRSILGRAPSELRNREVYSALADQHEPMLPTTPGQTGIMSRRSPP